jgi:hypothetical protein
LLEKYSGRAFVIDELPVSQGIIGLHLDNNLKFDRFKHAQYLLAAMNLISHCNTVITHTGNIGYWQGLFRGNLKDFYQDMTYFHRIKGIESVGSFNCLPLKYRVNDVFQENDKYVLRYILSKIARTGYYIRHPLEVPGMIKRKISKMY